MKLGIRRPLDKIHYKEIFCSKCITINNIIRKFLLAQDKFIPEMYI